MTRRTFKDRGAQQVYDKYSATPPERAGRALVSDYWRGFDHADRPSTLAVRGSLAYAAWAAGVDARRRADKAEALAIAQHDPGQGGANRWRLGEVEPMTGGTVVHVDGLRAVMREAGGGGFYIGYAPPEAREPGRSWCYGDADDGATFLTLESAVAALVIENGRDL